MVMQDVGSSLVVPLELAGSILNTDYQLQKNLIHSSNIA
jgi:hypothetical protein